ncbi:MAG TPA: T9SS type A sorting domain-containing protein [Caldithrix abyssi]|uniref:T9SS type A sorting domain-containing protein n=1 Tax=Caldithrix abyssi TaxID=187145 RepID=A0A7V4U188_CALAY|nr:T9SS type A sorting domain-containing protein [Caldithrix abyssi]
MNYLYFFDRNGEYTGESYQDSTHNFQKSHKDFDFTFKVGSNRFFNPTLYGEDIYVDVYEGFTKADSFKVGTVTDLNQRRTSVSQDFILQQNYPNPFNPSTVISYQLPGLSDVELTVYNALGQKVATLVREKQPAGQYSVNFDAGGLASGVYYCRLQAGNFRQVKKMLLIR